MIAVSVRRTPNVGWQVFYSINGKEVAAAFFQTREAANAEATLSHETCLSIWELAESDDTPPVLNLARDSDEEA